MTFRSISKHAKTSATTSTAEGIDYVHGLDLLASFRKILLVCMIQDDPLIGREKQRE
jgi:hypothetical protein